MKFLEAVANVFRVPDLRKRLMFALALLAVYRLGGHIPTPGIDTNRLEEFFRQNSGHSIWIPRSVQRRDFPEADDFRAGHHALHHVVHYFAVADGGGSHAREIAERRRARTPQDHAMDALSDGDPGADSILRHRDGAAGSPAGLRHQSGHRVHSDDHAQFDHRDGLHHVARRADYRARHRQRDVADHLYGHRGQPAECDLSNW